MKYHCHFKSSTLGIRHDIIEADSVEMAIEIISEAYLLTNFETSNVICERVRKHANNTM